MLKKAGTIVALAAAGLLAVSPLAFAGEGAGKDVSRSLDVVDQDNEQESEQGNGILNGNNILSGNSVQVCNTGVDALNNVLGALIAVASPITQTSAAQQGGGECDSSGTAVGQNTTQGAENENDS